MKLALIVLAFLFASCGGERNVDAVPPVQETTETYITTNINGFEISLRNENGQCALFYSKKDKIRAFTDKRIMIDMEAPCNFIHLFGRDELQFYEYGDKLFRYKIFMIVGGPPDAEFPNLKDRFMPKGCGTMMQKILVYSDRIRVEYPARGGAGTICPSEPIDEVLHAT